MKTKIRRIISTLMLATLILVLVTLMVGTIAKAKLAKKYPAPGQLVDVGGYKMHINCTGQGSPTVILASGMSDFSVSWAYVQPEIAKYTRVCSYDRAGMGWSEPSPNPSIASAMVEELHTLLANARVEGPYVMVGHSMGGMLVRVYANNYPDEVVGMVLVDSLHEARNIRLPELMMKDSEDAIGQFRMLALLKSTGLMALAPQSIPPMGLHGDAYAQWQAIMATTGYFETSIAETNAMAESCADVRALHITSFGDMPLIVLSVGREDADPSHSNAENQQFLEESQMERFEFAALSSESKQIIAEQSGHFIQREQPDLVIDAIREILDALRK